MEWLSSLSATWHSWSSSGCSEGVRDAWEQPGLVRPATTVTPHQCPLILDTRVPMLGLCSCLILCSHIQSPEASLSFCMEQCRSPAWSTRRASSQSFTQSHPGILMKYCSVLQVWKPNKLNEFLKVTGGVDSNFKQSPADWHLNDRLTVPLHFDSLAAGGKADWGLKVKQLHFNFAVC